VTLLKQQKIKRDDIAHLHNVKLLDDVFSGAERRQ